MQKINEIEQNTVIQTTFTHYHVYYFTRHVQCSATVKPPQPYDIIYAKIDCIDEKKINTADAIVGTIYFVNECSSEPLPPDTCTMTVPPFIQLFFPMKKFQDVIDIFKLYEPSNLALTFDTSFKIGSITPVIKPQTSANLYQTPIGGTSGSGTGGSGTGGSGTGGSGTGHGGKGTGPGSGVGPGSGASGTGSSGAGGSTQYDSLPIKLGEE